MTFHAEYAKRSYAFEPELDSPSSGAKGLIAPMTDLHLKLPIASFLLQLFGKSRTAYFLGLILLFVQPWADQYLVAQTQPSAKLEIGHDFWGFKDNAPPETVAFAQTSDGFLWLRFGRSVVSSGRT